MNLKERLIAAYLQKIDAWHHDFRQKQMKNDEIPSRLLWTEEFGD